MKKYLSIVILVICVSWLVACQNTVEKNVNNDNDLNSQESVVKPDETTQQESPEINNQNMGNANETLEEDTLNDEEKLIEKFKLSDDISLSYDMKKNSLYNLYYDVDDPELYSPISLDITLNGNAHTFSGKSNGPLDVGGFLEIDGKKITEASGDEYFSQRWINGIGIIYLENKPYIVMRWYEGSIGGDILYSINDNLELTYEKSFEELYKVGDKYIAPDFFKKADYDHIRDGIVIGYWYYENNEWKYTNHSINGKILIDEEGNFSEELYVEGEGMFSLGVDYSGFFTQKLGAEVSSLLTTSRYRIIKRYTDSLYVYDIEMLEDSTWGIAKAENIYDRNNFDYSGNWIGEIENEEYIPAGTIVEKVLIHGIT